MKTNRRKFLRFLPFAAALPFIRIPNKPRINGILSVDSEPHPSFQLLKQPKIPTEILEQIEISQKRVNDIPGKCYKVHITAEGSDERGWRKVNHYESEES